MGIIVRARKIGNSLYLNLPNGVQKHFKIKHGDYFELEQDMLLPDLYSLKRMNY